MEIEMKYSIPDRETSEAIWEDEYLASIEEADTRENIVMKAVYFDTEDYVLSRNDIAMRVRLEGERVVATIKSSGKSEDGLHVREEINVPVDDEKFFLVPDLQVFKESEIGQQLIGLVGFKTLFGVIETNFLRSCFKVDNGKGIMEVAIDRGEIITREGNEPICELEIELFSGEEDALKEVTQTLVEKYNLQAEDRSKYARGLALLGAER